MNEKYKAQKSLVRVKIWLTAINNINKTTTQKTNTTHDDDGSAGEHAVQLQ